MAPRNSLLIQRRPRRSRYSSCTTDTDYAAQETPSNKNAKNIRQTPNKTRQKATRQPPSPLQHIQKIILYALRTASRTRSIFFLFPPPPAWSVKTRRAPTRHCRDARVYGHTLRPCMRSSTYILSSTPPPPPCNRPPLPRPDVVHPGIANRDARVSDHIVRLRPCMNHEYNRQVGENPTCSMPALYT